MSDKKALFCLLLILAVAFALRVLKLNNQSLWIDELNTMNECSPSLPWSEFISMLIQFDPHPPLYFIIMRFLFSVFGYSEFMARFFSVCCGTLSVWLMFLLGKEIRDRELGLFAALLTAVNYFNLYYSQEARDYILVFALTSLSFLLLIKLIKKRTWFLTCGYSVATVAMICTHYFCLFVFAAQLVLMAVVFLTNKMERKSYLSRFFAVCLMIGLGSLSCLPFFLAAGQRKSFWITHIPPAFPVDFFISFFGNSFLLQPLLILLLLFFAVKVLVGDDEHEGLSLPFVFSILFLWVAVSLLIPYVYSLLTIPVITNRYGIVVLPAYLVAVAYGLRLIRPPGVKVMLASALTVFSIFHVVLFDKFYSSIYKTQFREVTEYVVRNNAAHYPIINEVAAWHQKYYLQKMGNKAEILAGRKINTINSILRKEKLRRRPPAFWIIGAHLDKPLTAKWQRKLDLFYTMRQKKKFFDAWAQFYRIREGMKDARVVGAGDFLPAANWRVNELGAVTLFSGQMQTRSFSLAPGQYEAAIYISGSAADGEFDGVRLEVNGQVMGDVKVTGQLDLCKFPFRLGKDQGVTISMRRINGPRNGTNGQPGVTVDLLVLYPAASK